MKVEDYRFIKFANDYYYNISGISILLFLKSKTYQIKRKAISGTECIVSEDGMIFSLSELKKHYDHFDFEII